MSLSLGTDRELYGITATARIRVLIAAVLGLTLLLVAIPRASGGAPTARVPVIVCPTGLGVNSPQTPVPSSATVPASASHLVVYSATSRYIQILGPKGLSCQAGIGADGSGTIMAAPAGNYELSLGHGGVAAVAYPTCVGCLLSLACPFFPAAEKAAQHESSLCQMSRCFGDFSLSFSEAGGTRGLPRRPSLGFGPGVAWPKSRFCGVRAGRAGY